MTSIARMESSQDMDMCVLKRTAPTQNLGEFIKDLVSSGSFVEEEEEKEECCYETDSAPSSGCTSLVTSFSDGTDPLPSEAKMEVVEAASPKKKSVKWAETVTVREECFDDSGNKCRSKDVVQAMKKAAVVKPTIERVTFDPEEEAIRSKLVGLIPAEKKRHHDYGRMYGCGPCLTRTDSSTDLDEDYESEEDDDDEVREPVRVIHASAPSAMWFSASLF